MLFQRADFLATDEGRTMTLKLTRAVLAFSIALIAYLLTSLVTERAMSMEKTTFTDSLTMALNAKTATILKKSCSTAGCHAGAYPKARLSLEPGNMLAALKNVTSRQIDSVKLVDATRPEKSYVVMKIRGEKGIKGERMPYEASSLENEEIRTIELWVYSIAAFARETAPQAPAENGKKKP